MNYILDRLKERSTWAGLVGMIAAFGVHLNPGQGESLVTLAVAAIGALFTFTKDKR